MVSSGYLFQNKYRRWRVEFVCNRDKESIKIWDEKYEAAINEALKENEIDG